MSTSSKLLIALLIIAVLAGGGAYYAKQQGWIGKKVLTKVSVEEAKKRTIVETVTASGKLYPETEVKISPDVSGEVIVLNVEEGDTVKAGQLLAKIEPDTYQSIVERTEAALNSSKANAANANARITQLKTQLKQRQRDYDRNKKLFDQDIIAQADLENFETMVEAAKADIKAAEQTLDGSNFNIKSAEANVKEAKNNLRRTNIYAPTSGIISMLSVEKGERVVGTSQFAGTEIMRIANFEDMELRVDVSENDIIKVKTQDTAYVEVDAYLDRKFEGVVTQISNANTTTMVSTDQVTNFTVKIRLLRDSYVDILEKTGRFPFRPQMSASADIRTKVVRDVLTVPIQSVTTRELADSLKKDDGDDELLEVVFVENSGKVTQKEVKTSIQDDNYIVVTNGLDSGEKVVNAPYREISKKLENEQEVEVVKKEELFKKKK